MARLKNVDVDFLSLVGKGANKQKVQIYKADTEEPEASNDDEVKGFFNAVKSFFTKADNKTKNKIPSFKERMAATELHSNMWRVNDTLSSTVRDIIRDQTTTIEDKQTSLNQAVDEYAEYMKNKIKGLTKVKKAEDFFKKEDDEDLDKEKLVDVIKEAVKPLEDKIEGFERESQKNEAQNEPEDTKKEDTEAITPDDIKKAVNEVIEPLKERLTKIENYKGISKQLQDEPVEKENKSVFAGLDIL